MPTVLTRICVILWLSAVLIACGNGAGRAPGTGDQPLETDTSAMRARLQQEPSNYALRLQLAEQLWRSQQHTKALVLLNEGIQADSSVEALWNARATIAADKGDTTVAIDCLEYSLRLDSSQSAEWLELGHLYAARGDMKAQPIARRLMQMSAAVDTRAEAWYLLGILYGNRQETANALTAFDSCIVLRYTFLDAHIEKGILLHGQGRDTEALAAFRLASSIQKANPDAWYWQGESLEAMGKKEEAAESYAMALSLDTTLRAAERGLQRTANRKVEIK